MTRALGNRPYLGCYVLGASIFLLGLIRDALYERALTRQPTWELMQHPAIQAAAIVSFISGSVLVGSSMWVLGVTGTYLGDYFGILMPAMVTGFPFNVVADPMYVGSTMCFAASALWYAKPAGLALTLLVAVVYTVALRFEGYVALPGSPLAPRLLTHTFCSDHLRRTSTRKLPRRRALKLRVR